MGFCLAPMANRRRNPPIVVDPYFANVILLAGLDGAEGSTTWPDEGPLARGNASVNYGDPANTTAVKKFGTSSLYLDGNDGIAWAAHADWQLQAVDFTIEMWVRLDASALAADQAFMSVYHTGSDSRSWFFSKRADGTLAFWGSANGASGAYLLSGPWSPVADTWYHVCVDRSGTTFRLYVDGAMVAKVDNAISFSVESVLGLRVGGIYSAGEVMIPKGYLDEVRFTRGVARYASDAGFAVPTAAYPRS